MPKWSRHQFVKLVLAGSSPVLTNHLFGVVLAEIECYVCKGQRVVIIAGSGEEVQCPECHGSGTLTVD